MASSANAQVVVAATNTRPSSTETISVARLHEALFAEETQVRARSRAPRSDSRRCTLQFTKPPRPAWLKLDAWLARTADCEKERLRIVLELARRCAHIPGHDAIGSVERTTCIPASRKRVSASSA